jgi:histidinol-phosphate/aromatic aminotransferase/cobyric acid decarboxylase-like protein
VLAQLEASTNPRYRALLQEELAAREIRFWPSQANFVLLYLGEALSPFIRAMREREILVRDRSQDPGCAGCVRITIGSLTQTDQLLVALREVLEQLGAREGVLR